MINNIDIANCHFAKRDHKRQARQKQATHNAQQGARIRWQAKMDYLKQVHNEIALDKAMTIHASDWLESVGV